MIILLFFFYSVIDGYFSKCRKENYNSKQKYLFKQAFEQIELQHRL